MSEKCEHSSAVVEAEYPGFSVLKCTWECGETLVSVLQDNGVTITYAAAEYVAVTDCLASIREAVSVKGRAPFAMVNDVIAALALLDEQKEKA